MACSCAVVNVGVGLASGVGLGVGVGWGVGSSDVCDLECGAEGVVVGVSVAWDLEGVSTAVVSDPLPEPPPDAAAMANSTRTTPTTHHRFFLYQDLEVGGGDVGEESAGPPALCPWECSVQAEPSHQRIVPCASGYQPAGVPEFPFPDVSVMKSTLSGMGRPLCGTRACVTNGPTEGTKVLPCPYPAALVPRPQGSRQKHSHTPESAQPSTSRAPGRRGEAHRRAGRTPLRARRPARRAVERRRGLTAGVRGCRGVSHSPIGHELQGRGPKTCRWGPIGARVRGRGKRQRAQVSDGRSL